MTSPLRASAAHPSGFTGQGGMTQDERIERLLDRTEIFDLLRIERHCRDVKNWPGLQNSYIPGAPVRTPRFCFQT